jgi:toxin CcdB
MVTGELLVYRNPSPRSGRDVPYVLCVQHRVLANLPTRVVVPLIRPAALANRPASRLNPEVQVGRERFVLLTQQLAALPLASLKVPVASLDARRADILGAIDVLFAGV